MIPPTIEDARALRERAGARAVLIIAIGDKIAMAADGETEAERAAMFRLAEAWISAVERAEKGTER